MSITDFVTVQNVTYAIKNEYLFKKLDNANNPTQIALPTNFHIPAVCVAAAPDDPNVVVVSSSYPYVAPWSEKVWLSTDGGNNWIDFGIPRAGFYAHITDIDISCLAGGLRHVFVATADKRDNNTEKGTIVTRPIINNPPPWTIYAGLVGRFDVMAIKVSPNFNNDRSFCAVGSIRNNGIQFIVARFIQDPVFYYDTIVSASTTGDYGDLNNAIKCADIALPSNYIPLHPVQGVAFVSLATNQLQTTDGIYRMKNLTEHLVISNAATTPGLGIKSIGFNGSRLIAGESTTNKVWYSSNPLVNNPNNISWAPITNPPQGHHDTIVRYHGNMIFAATSGTNSGLSQSNNYSNFTLLFS